MPYVIIFLDEFTNWLDDQHESLRLRTLAQLALLREHGPLLTRPYVDTLSGSQITNLKELRLNFRKAPIRILFAFDPKRQAVVILAGNKQGDKRWYDTNIPLAEKLFEKYLERERKSADK